MSVLDRNDHEGDSRETVGVAWGETRGRMSAEQPAGMVARLACAQGDHEWQQVLAFIDPTGSDSGGELPIYDTLCAHCGASKPMLSSSVRPEGVILPEEIW